MLNNLDVDDKLLLTDGQIVEISDFRYDNNLDKVDVWMRYNHQDVFANIDVDTGKIVDTDLSVRQVVKVAKV